MLDNIKYHLPMEIEKRSFELISKELGDRKFNEEESPVIKRVIHTTADFDYADNLYFGADAVKRGISALRAGAHIVTDTTMALSGINKRALGALGASAHCFISDSDVVQRAKEQNTTRSAAAMEKASQFPDISIFVVGNAPTALIKIFELLKQNKIKPDLVVGVPVGFVNVVESKELFLELGVPSIIARGRKGGSNVAAAIINALLYQISEERGL